MPATPAATRAFAEKFSAAPGWFREAPALGATVSSVGVGTYLGPATDAADDEYAEAVARAISLGANVVDTAANYRWGRSEAAVGRGLLASGVPAEAVVVSTKGGYLPGDASWFAREVVRPGHARLDDLVAGCHCIAPGYLRWQLARSLEKLKVNSVTFYYLHNPEQQLDEVDRAEFARRMRDAFAALEGEADAGRLAFYGTATWNGYRVPADAPDHLDLAELSALARDVAGERHRFRALQLPFNLAMREAAEAPTQRGRPLLDVAREAGFFVMASASLSQGRLSPARAALHFVRSTPGVTVALCGMRRRAHVEENLALIDK